MGHTFDSAAAQITRLERELEAVDRGLDGFQICLGGAVETAGDVERWESLGVTRLIVSPWRRSPDAVEGLRAFAARFGLSA
jgi:hypothetical protein